MNHSLPDDRSLRPHRDHDAPPRPAHHWLREFFRRFAAHMAGAVGSPWAFAIALAAIIVWAVLGARYHFSDTWQLVINTGTTIVTFLMVFLIQNTQNRDARAIQLKLDELIRGTRGPRNLLVDLEERSEEELDHFEREFRRLRDRVRAQRRHHRRHGHHQEHPREDHDGGARMEIEGERPEPHAG